MTFLEGYGDYKKMVLMEVDQTNRIQMLQRNSSIRNQCMGRLEALEMFLPPP